MENARITGTPYDDVFRTLLNDCSRLIIRIIRDGKKSAFRQMNTF